MSAKRRARMEAYREARDERQRMAGGRCELRTGDRCLGWGSEAHHMKGRVGDLLTNVSLLRWSCRNCHAWVTEHPQEAFDNGWSLHRNAL